MVTSVSRWRGTAGSFRNAGLAQAAEARDGGVYDVAGAEESLRTPRRAHAGGCAGADDVARREGDDRGQEGDQLGDAEDHVAGTAALDGLAVDGALHLEVVEVGDR